MSKQQTPTFAEFDQATYEAWKIAATKLLKGGDPEDKLNWSSVPSIKLNAYYNAETASEESLKVCGFFSDHSSPNEWIQYESVPVASGKEKEANRLAREALNLGCEGVFFRGDLSDINFNQLLNSILPEHCFLSFEHMGADKVTLPEIVQLKGFGINTQATNSQKFSSQAFNLLF